MSALDRLTDRRPVVGHDGRSGALLETAVLDGRRVYVKTSAPEQDVGALLIGTDHIELDLFRAGALDRLPAGVGSALLAVERTPAGVVTVTRDLGDAVLTWDRLLGRGEVERLFAAIGAVHDRGLPAGVDLCPLDRRLRLFAPDRLPALVEAGLEVASSVLRGQELLVDLVPPEVADAITGTYDDPAPMARAMAAAGTTLLHGDLWLVNLAVEDDVVIPLDWGFATAGPPALDLVAFCVGATANVAMTRAALLDLARASCGRFADDAVFDLAELWALVEHGWNKALDAVDHPDAAQRATAADDLDFWVGRARRALDRGLVP